MAKGPHSSDTIEAYLIMTTRMAVDSETWEEVRETERYDGTIDWPDFDEVDVEDFLDEREQMNDYVDENLQRLDQIYDATKASDSNPDRLDGLKFLADEDGERPESNPTWWRWRNGYEEAGLTEDDELTRIGEAFLESSDSDLELPDIYRELRTTGNSSSGESSGQKIKAFMLYGSGLDTGEVDQRVSLDREHLRQTRQNLVYGHELMEKDGALTRDGRQMYSLIVDQLNLVENFT